MLASKENSREGIKSYYQQKIEELEVIIRDKEQNNRRLEAQRNDWNSKGTHYSHPNTLLLLL
jgi:26S proteasome regulatory subunit T6